MPVINVGDPDIRGQMARGPVGPTMPNMSPSPPGMNQSGLAGMAGAPGMQPAALKVPKATPRTGPTSAPKGPTIESVRKHGLALGGLQHAMDIHPEHAPVLKQMMGKSQAHIAGYRSGKAKFGSLGGGKLPKGQSFSGGGQSNIPGTSSKSAGGITGMKMPSSGEADDGY